MKEREDPEYPSWPCESPAVSSAASRLLECPGRLTGRWWLLTRPQISIIIAFITNSEYQHQHYTLFFNTFGANSLKQATTPMWQNPMKPQPAKDKFIESGSIAVSDSAGLRDVRVHYLASTKQNIVPSLIIKTLKNQVLVNMKNPKFY